MKVFTILSSCVRRRVPEWVERSKDQTNTYQIEIASADTSEIIVEFAGDMAREDEEIVYCPTISLVENLNVSDRKAHETYLDRLKNFSRAIGDDYTARNFMVEKSLKKEKTSSFKVATMNHWGKSQQDV